MLALSTSWNTAFHRFGIQVIDEIKELGFHYCELGFSHTKAQLASIINAKERGIVSLHNYCPIPEGLGRAQALPDSVSLSSPDNAERKAALKFTKRTIQYAKKLKARAVILHCGRVETTDYTKQLCVLKQAGDNTGAFERLKTRAVEEREQKKALFLDRILASIKELADYAHDEGIFLGIENRIYVREIPNFSEIKLLLENFSKKSVRYWHDTGHAYVLDKLGFSGHLEYLKAYHRSLVGIHLHDVDGFRDHKTPFTGELDFGAFTPYLKTETIKVIEAHRPASRVEILFAKEKLEKLFNS